jgi:peptidoglycan/xylan/chitin deacetylase (PgdA/CDA1 family)
MNNKKKSLFMLKTKTKNIVILSLIYISLFIFSVEFFRAYFISIKAETITVFSTLDQMVIAEEVGLYISQERVSPFSVLPGDDEKNIALPQKRPNIPMYPKEVYLTFDDGPTKKNTTVVLDILRENNVKASFFVIGDLAEKNQDLIKRMQEDGMTILPHSYSHEYAIYKSESSYFQDLEKCISVIKGITGKELPPFIRMPGGSDNLVGPREVLKRIRKSLRDQDIRYVDWNVSSLDASSNVVDKDIIVSSVINKCKTTNLAVVLMHDANSKSTTAEALPEIIKFLKENGFVFRTFEDLTEEEESAMIKRKIIYK